MMFYQPEHPVCQWPAFFRYHDSHMAMKCRRVREHIIHNDFFKVSLHCASSFPGFLMDYLFLMPGCSQPKNDRFLTIGLGHLSVPAVCTAHSFACCRNTRSPASFWRCDRS